MGRYYLNSKTEADNLLKLSVYWLKKNGFLKTHCYKSGAIEWKSGLMGNKSSIGIEASLLEGDNYIRLFYSQTESNGVKKDFDYKIPLTTTPCNYGGIRCWFTCPLIINGNYCGRRVGVLYKAGDYFGCRHCYNLTYKSRNKNRRSKNSPLFSILNDYQKISELKTQIKKSTYAGKPTKKQRKIEKLYAKNFINCLLLKKQKKI